MYGQGKPNSASRTDTINDVKSKLHRALYHEKNKLKQGPYSFMDEIVIDFFAI